MSALRVEFPPLERPWLWQGFATEKEALGGLVPCLSGWCFVVFYKQRHIVISKGF